MLKKDFEGSGRTVPSLQRTPSALLPGEIELEAVVLRGRAMKRDTLLVRQPERVRRWFCPLSGDLRPGGSFQLEGNAGGTITTCEPPHQLQLTWQFGDAEPSLVSLELAPAAGDTTELVLRRGEATSPKVSIIPGAERTADEKREFAVFERSLGRGQSEADGEGGAADWDLGSVVEEAKP